MVFDGFWKQSKSWVRQVDPRNSSIHNKFIAHLLICKSLAFSNLTGAYWWPLPRPNWWRPQMRSCCRHIARPDPSCTAWLVASGFWRPTWERPARSGTAGVGGWLYGAVWKIDGNGQGVQWKMYPATLGWGGWWKQLERILFTKTYKTDGTGFGTTCAGIPAKWHQRGIWWFLGHLSSPDQFFLWRDDQGLKWLGTHSPCQALESAVDFLQSAEAQWQWVLSRQTSKSPAE